METKLVTFSVDMYFQPVTVIVGDKEVAIEWMRKRLRPSAFESSENNIRGSNGYALQAHTGNGAHNMIWVPDIDKNYDTLVHESLHIAFYMLDYVGIHADPRSQEALAYLQGYLLDQIKKRYAKASVYKATKKHSKRSNANSVSNFESASLVRAVSHRKAMVRA